MPTLLDILRDPRHQERLRRRQKEHISALLGPEQQPETTATALAMSMAVGADELARLRDDLASADPDRQREALDQIAAISDAVTQVHPSVMAAVTTHLLSEDETVSAAAAYALGEIGPTAATSEVRAAIAALLDRGDTQSLMLAEELLARLGPAVASPGALAALIRRLSDAYEVARGTAARALGSLADSAANPEVIAALIRCLDDEAPSVRIGAIVALGQLGTAVELPDVIGALISHLHDGVAAVRTAIMSALDPLPSRMQALAIQAAETRGAIISQIVAAFSASVPATLRTKPLPQLVKADALDLETLQYYDDDSDLVVQTTSTQLPAGTILLARLVGQGTTVLARMIALAPAGVGEVMGRTVFPAAELQSLGNELMIQICSLEPTTSHTNA